MHSVYEIGIVGMGPAGIGMATSLYGTPKIRNTICFERGNNNVNINCPALMQMCVAIRTHVVLFLELVVHQR